MTNGEKYKTAHERAEAFIKNYWSMANTGGTVNMLEAFSKWLNRDVPHWVLGDKEGVVEK